MTNELVRLVNDSRSKGQIVGECAHCGWPLVLWRNLNEFWVREEDPEGLIKESDGQ